MKFLGNKSTAFLDDGCGPHPAPGCPPALPPPAWPHPQHLCEAPPLSLDKPLIWRPQRGPGYNCAAKRKIHCLLLKELKALPYLCALAPALSLSGARLKPKVER